MSNSLFLNQPLDMLSDQKEKLQIVPVEYEYKENEINLSASPDCDGLIYVSVPYSAGWRAELDGEKADILKVNGFGMGIAVTKGEHVLRLWYRTPYLMTGCRISFLSFVIVLTLALKRIINAHELLMYENMPE